VVPSFVHEFLPGSYDFSVHVEGAAKVDPNSSKRAFDQILHASLRIGHRTSIVNAQHFVEQINRLIARAVERFNENAAEGNFRKPIIEFRFDGWRACNLG
jgi:hypothetical protein